MRWTAALMGLALLVGAPLSWQAAQPTATVGRVPATVAASGAAAVVPAAPPAGTPASTATPTAAPATRPPATPADTTPPPEAVTIPALGVAAPVVAVGLRPDGAMEIPDDVTTVGWYAPGPRPGEPGTAVLAGHVDSREQGPGAFFELRRLSRGATIQVEHVDGRTHTWRVVGRASYPKDELPIADIFTGSGGPRLALITCGGRFDPVTGSYRENVVVFAEPAA